MIAIREQMRRYETDAYELGRVVGHYGSKPETQLSYQDDLDKSRDALLALIDAAITAAEAQSAVIGKSIPEHWL